MPDPIFMRIGEEGNAVELPQLVGAMGDFLGLLRDVDSAVSNKKSGNLRWRVTTLSKSPSPLVGVTPFLPRPTSRDTSAAVEQEVIGNVVSLTEKGTRTKLFPDAALDRIVRIAKNSSKIGDSEIYTSKSDGVIYRTSVSVKTFTQIQEIRNVKSVSFGTVIGSLDSISVHKAKEFRVWDESTDRPVRCKFKGDLLSSARDLLGHRVIVSGMISADQSGLPISLVVESLLGFELGNLPSITDLMGAVPNLTGGLSLREFFEDFD
jgi:hypothetical protein